MPKYSLTTKDSAYLTIEIGGKDYNIPLAKKLKVKEIRKLKDALKLPEDEQLDFIIDFLGNYLGAELVDDLTMEDLTEVFQYWIQANNEADGLKLGELSASPNS